MKYGHTSKKNILPVSERYSKESTQLNDRKLTTHLLEYLLQ